MIIGMVPIGKYPNCTECLDCEFPMIENKCGKFNKANEAIEESPSALEEEGKR
jgi:hypothetical protein